jgi:hypothetical protein
VKFHDELVKRNEVDTGVGAKPEWLPLNGEVVNGPRALPAPDERTYR